MATVTTDTFFRRDVFGKRSLWRELEFKGADRKYVSEMYVDESLKTLGDAIHDIYNHNTKGLNLEELCSKAYNLVLHEFGEKLYSSIVSTITSLLNEMAVLIEGSPGDLFLEELDRKWTEHNKALQLIEYIFLYMDRTFIPSTHKTPVLELGLNLWRDNIIHTMKIQTRLLEHVKIERGGGSINRGLMKNAVNMLRSFGSSSYQEYFEKPFLVATADFYRGESQLLIESCGCGDYLKIVEKRLNEETGRVSRYLDPRSKRVLHYLVIKHMIESQMNRLVHMENSGLVCMLMGDKYEDLGRMYTLFKRALKGLSLIKEVMTSHIRDTGKQLVTDPERLKDPVDLVQRLSDERDKYDKIINLAFKNDKDFRKAFNSSFEYFINLNTRSPEFISLFLDDKLRKGFEGVSEEDVEILLDKVIMLFRYLQEKDIFQTYYRRHLAKRLLSKKRVSDEAERSLILKLKTECGEQFTSRFERMFSDMKTSEDTMKQFYEAMGPELGDGPTLVVSVLTTGSWPIKSTPTCKLPSEIQTVCDKFTTYYRRTYPRLSLTWQTNMGSADIKATFGKGQEHELLVSTYQMCVLMLFNSVDRLSYREIEQATEIPILNLKQCLQSLACIEGKNVLRKEPMSKDIGEDDVFFFNDKFSSEFYRVNIAQMEPELEKQEVRQGVEDRKPQIDAAIVRIMKVRRALDHDNIVAEVTKQLQSRFLPDPVVIKQRIEALIKREFLELDKDDQKLYRYVP